MSNIDLDIRLLENSTGHRSVTGKVFMPEPMPMDQLYDLADLLMALKTVCDTWAESDKLSEPKGE